MKPICPECESINNIPDSIDNFPTPPNAQLLLCLDCLATFHTLIEKSVDNGGLVVHPAA